MENRMKPSFILRFLGESPRGGLVNVLVATLDQLPHGFKRTVEAQLFYVVHHEGHQFPGALCQLGIQIAFGCVAWRWNSPLSKPLDHCQCSAHEIAKTVC